MAECPTCGDKFDSVHGMKIHHSKKHGESIAGTSVECSYCGDETKVKPAHAKKFDRHFCDRVCLNRQLAKENIPDSFEESELERVKCAECGEEMWRKPARVSRTQRQFCNRECFNKYREVDGPRRYDNAEWRRTREQIRKRDGNRCQSCGLSNEKHLEKYDRALDVHHIQPARTFDSAENAHEPDNLVTLCILCHNKWERVAPLRPDTQTAD